MRQDTLKALSPSLTTTWSHKNLSAAAPALTRPHHRRGQRSAPLARAQRNQENRAVANQPTARTGSRSPHTQRTGNPTDGRVQSHGGDPHPQHEAQYRRYSLTENRLREEMAK